MRLLWVCAALAGAGSATQPPAISLPEYLRRNQFTQKDLEAIERGAAVAKLVQVEEKTETRILGVVKIRGNPEDYVARQRDIVKFERGTGVLQIGHFRDPATAADLDGLTLDEEDFEDLKNCRPGECDIKLSDSSIEAFRKLDWEAPDVHSTAEQAARRMLADFLNAYRSGGNEALSAFHDKKKPLLVKEQFESMIEMRDLPTYFPSLHAFLKDYPRATIPGSEELFYWSKVDFGLKPVVRLNHVVIYRPKEIEAVPCVIASKMIYTTHYFNTGLELKFLVVSGDSPGSYYLVSMNQSRSDGLTGFIGTFAGGRIRGKAREGSEKYLAAVKKIMEAGM
ncbi:MAG TPA: hypothetical protein VLK65_00930 [Vicinamibacteria bacterium]|nr:hypothetical protein [Vicinamibacteria bacterium]